MNKFAWIIFGWLSLLNVTHAASFDCAKATTKIEKLICSDDELSKLDEDLNKAYRHSLLQGKNKQTQINAQRQWLKEILNSCQDINCLLSTYKNRINLLSSKPINTFRDCTECPEMVVIPAGSFNMTEIGSMYRVKPDNFATYNVTLKSFAMGKTEVTQAQWRAVMGSNPNKFSSCGDNCPVGKVNWYEAKEYIHKLNIKTDKQYRLPSDTEWEYACLAGMKLKYCGSNSLDSVAWYGGIEDHEVATKQANAFGLFDMTGNIWEWVEDCSQNKYGGDCSELNYDKLDTLRVTRGGGWNSKERALLAIFGNLVDPSLGSNQSGFRIAISIQ